MMMKNKNAILRQILILLCISIASIAHSQNKKEVLDGIFKIRLGMSESEIKRVVGTKYITHSYNLLNISSIRLLSLDEYEPINGFVIERIKLSFFEDKLYKIEIGEYNENLENLLTEKYGKPKSKKEIDTEGIPYAERTSEDDTRREISTIYMETWKTQDKNIICTSEYKFYKKGTNSRYNLIIMNKIEHNKVSDAISQKILNEGKIEEKDKKILLEEI